MKENEPYNLDIESTDFQPMSRERATKTVLKETFTEYFGGLNYFFGTERVNLTYEAVVAHIGVDPSGYRYDAAQQAQLYSWYSAESSACVLHVWFRCGKLYACGAYNLGFPKMS